MTPETLRELDALPESVIVDALASAGCLGTIRMSFESGPYDITRPSFNATKFAEAIAAAVRPALLAELRRLEAERETADTLVKGYQATVRELQEKLNESEAYRISFRNHITTVNAERDALKAQCELLRAQEEISSDVIAFYQGKYFELDAANAGLATEAERLRSGLRWYAHGEHYAGLDDWEDGADPECPNWLEPNDDGASGAMVENGHCARLVLSGQTPDWDGEPPMEHPCEPVMQAIAALPPSEKEKQT